jgi:predicted CXXCH cytochrome family protein
MTTRKLKISILLLACLAAYWLQAASSAAQLRGGKFPHAQAGKQGLQGHRDLACSQCHTSSAQPPYEVTGKPSPGVTLVMQTQFPGHASCVQCHNFAAMFFAKPAFCGICHAGRAESLAQPGLFASFQTARAASDFGIDFSHPAHRRPLPAGLSIVAAASRSAALRQAQLAEGAALRCTDCHARIASANAQEFSTESGHTVCFTCHLQKPAQAAADFPARNDCRGCHELTDGGQRQQGPALWINFKVLDFRHADHELDTRSVKKSEARQAKPADYLCVECHSAAANAERLSDIKAPRLGNCVSCHNDKRQPGLPEPLNAEVLRTLSNQ